MTLDPRPDLQNESKKAVNLITSNFNGPTFNCFLAWNSSNRECIKYFRVFKNK